MFATAAAAPYFLPFVVPICLFVAYNDMKFMKIPNLAVLALLGVFAVLGPFLFPLADYGWRLLGAVIVLALGFILNMLRAIGAGDAKFAAAMAPYISLGEVNTFVLTFAAILAASLITHRMARRTTRVRNMVPDWASWTHDKFPMGLALAPTLAIYLIALTVLNMRGMLG